MARPLRIERVGGWYHITARGNERRDIFRDDRDRRRFLELLEQAVSMFAPRLHAYVLMSNHYHLLIELTEPNLSRAIHWLNVSYTVWLNRRHGRSGHLLQGRFKSVLVELRGWGLEVRPGVEPMRWNRVYECGDGLEALCGTCGKRPKSCRAGKGSHGAIEK